ncbi:MAG: VIT1/CCC1 transporter family protein [Candidatus Micrarchaeota archaeon]
MRVDFRGIRHKQHLEQHRGVGSRMRELILGGQDGLVNVLGLVLGVAGATSETKIVIAAGLAALAAESISMAAVAYTSSKAQSAYYDGERRREFEEIREVPEEEREEIRRIFKAKGFSGRDLERAVSIITSDDERWVDVMMSDELKLEKPERSATSEAAVVGVSTVVGSVVPLIPFFLLPVASAMWYSVILTCAVLFGVGAYKARVTVGSWLYSGAEMAGIGLVAAVLGYLIGAAVGASPLFG